MHLTSHAFSMLYVCGVEGEARTGVMLEMTEVAPCLRHFAPQNLMGTPEVERESTLSIVPCSFQLRLDSEDNG